MPGIVGVVGRPDAGCSPALLRAMLRAIKNHVWYQEDQYSDVAAGIGFGRSTLGFVNKGKQPVHNEDHSLLAIMEGEIHDYEEQRRALVATGHIFWTDSHAELLVHGFESKGKSYFRELNGTFVAAIWDSANRRLMLVNDRFGMKPLYYVQLPSRLLFASEIKALLIDPEVPRSPNLRGIAQFFAFGQLLGEDTLVDRIRHFPGAGLLIYDVPTEALTLETYWQMEATRVSKHGTATETLDRIDSAFQRAVDRRVASTSRLGLSLSGGLDSRSILAVLDRGTPITTVSMGVEGSMDHTSARHMADLFGCEHHCFYLTTQFLADFEKHLRWLVHVTDGHYQSQCVSVPTLSIYRELGIEVLLRGHAGELLHMNKAYNYSLDQSVLGIQDEHHLEEWLYQHLRAFVSAPDAGPLFAKTHSGMEALARESLAACFPESAAIEPLANRVWHLFLTQRLRRETALSMVEFGSLVETRLPFLDNDLIDVLFKVGPEIKLGERIQAHILRRHLPAFLKVVNVNTGAPVGAGPLRRLAAKAKVKVLARLGVRGYQPYERLGRWLREELRPFVSCLLLSERCLDRGVLDAGTIRAVVDGHLSGKRNYTFLLMAMLIFELGQREFCDGDGYTVLTNAAGVDASAVPSAASNAGSNSKC
jgi:asparagine synthase (glutamine-hydrolysing)